MSVISNQLLLQVERTKRVIKVIKLRYILKRIYRSLNTNKR